MSKNNNMISVFGAPREHHHNLKCMTIQNLLKSDVSCARAWYDHVTAHINNTDKLVTFHLYINDINVSRLEAPLKNILFMDCDDMERALKNGDDWGYGL